MSNDPARELSVFRPTHEFFIGIDSDGCAFDTMEIKHKECFIPNTIRHFELQAVSKFAREAAEFVNLYSKWRGVNRFPALSRTLDLLAQRPEVRQRGCPIPRLPALHAWLQRETRPGNPVLEAAIAQVDGEQRDELSRVLTWSRAVNAAVEQIVYGIPPFPHVREALEVAVQRADIVVVSATPTDALQREWREHDLAQFTRLIAGQELGTKKDHLHATTAGRYAAQHVLMIGDAPGDLDAARACDALFYPIVPGKEEASWRRLCREGLERFFAGRYAGAFESSLIEDFERSLPDKPPWDCARATRVDCMDYFAQGSPTTVIDAERVGVLLDVMLERLGRLHRVLLVPPDATRRASGAGELTVMLYERLQARNAEVVVMPALGTHAAMREDELAVMFRGIPRAAFREHNWRRDLATLGEIPAEFIAKVTDARLEFPIKCEVNRLLVEQPWDRIISIGQLVPHEVIGIANHNKNIFVGLGGADVINKTHFVGAVCGMEQIMGRPRSPVRDVLDYMTRRFAADLLVSYVLSVRGRDERGQLVTRGLFGGDDARCFERGAELCRSVNLDLLDEPLRKAVVFLDPREYHSTWLGNKAIYRTRMALADGGELIILAPNVNTFGEDPEVDRLIRKYGYHGTSRTLQAIAENEDLQANLAAAAHLIHGSTEGRFGVTYCPGGLTQSEIEGVGYAYADIDDLARMFDPSALRDGWNTSVSGGEFFYVSNPGQGLWALRSRFDQET